MNQNQYLHEVAITAIIVKDDKYLITRRSPLKKRFPGQWTIPGGRLQTSDYTSLATIHPDGAPSLVISCMADYLGGEVKLQEEESDSHAWVTLEEAKNYNLIDGIYDELAIAEKKRSGQKAEWQRSA